MQKNKASKSQWLMVATCLVTFSIFMWWWNDTEPIEDNTEYWIPTEEDKMYLDSLYIITVKAILLNCMISSMRRTMISI